MTPTIIGGIVFLLIALCTFAGVISSLTSKYFDEDEVRKNIIYGSMAWGMGVVLLIMHFLITLMQQ